MLVAFLMVILILFICRELVQPTEMVSADARQIHMGAHLGPPLSSNSNVIPSRGFPGTGWNEMMVKYREVYRGSSVRKNNLILQMFSILQVTDSFQLNPWRRLLDDKSYFTNRT